MKTYLSRHDLDELMKLEEDPSWYFGTLAWLSSKELPTWNAMSAWAFRDIEMIAVRTSSSTQNPMGIFPTLGPLLQQCLLRASVRGFMLGTRRTSLMHGVYWSFNRKNKKAPEVVPDGPRAILNDEDFKA